MTSPTVSVILPTLNEQPYLRDCLDSLLDQDAGDSIEILVVDGGSTDATVAIAEAAGEPVRVIRNARVNAASAMNLGMAAARGDIIVRADAHARYDRDYISRSVAVLLDTGAAVVGGPMRPVGTTTFGRAIAAVTSSPFGVGPGRFHYADRAQEVETVYLGVFRRDTAVAVGGFDEQELQWAAEDQELNYRIRKAGGQIWLDPSIRSVYFPRETPRALWRQYVNYGVCKASTLNKHGTLPYWRPLVPAAMVAGAAVLAGVGVVARRPLVAVAPQVTYMVGATAVAIRLSRSRGVATQRALGALAICHWGYGLGFWWGIGRIVTGRPFDTRPRGHRSGTDHHAPPGRSVPLEQPPGDVVPALITTEEA
jgi:GT2 family glycosyltransferase